MENDPFYLQIVEHLNGHLDHHLFQVCAGDLLGTIYPGLVPFRGGDDSGMDGAIPDWEGEPFPLVVTTGEDAIGNLTHNLKTYTADGGKRRKAVFATSRRLTFPRKRNLYKRAEELGFVLFNVHDRDWFAPALYRNPEWCLTLLGLTGSPAALSTIPMTSRPLLDQTLIGREGDQVWLTTAAGDRLLVGQPGSGKTFLLYQFAKEGGGLFVVSEDLRDVANGIRSQQPGTLIVDDAHTKVDLLQNLVHLRREIGANFAILASSWPGEQTRIIETLQLPPSATHELGLLGRDQIVEVVRGVGIHGPMSLVREIVNQADGRPGLAVTLAHVCLTGGPRELMLGDVLSRSVQSFFVPSLGQEVVAILAAFSIGGDAGMRKEVVAKEIGLGLGYLWSTVSLLDAGGILFQRPDGCLAVYPRALRHALVRDVFFRQPALSLRLESFMPQAPSLCDVTDTLIGVCARGGNIPGATLWDLLVRLDSVELWQKFAWSGKNQVLAVLRKLPDKIDIVGHAALSLAPVEALPLLFQSAVGDNRPLNSVPDHPIRVMQGWVKSARPGTGLAIQRRKLVVEEACRWFAGNGNVAVGSHALRTAFSPYFEDNLIDPAHESAVILRFGCLMEEEIAELKALWPIAFEQLKSTETIDWEQVFGLVEDWVFPGRSNPPVSGDIYQAMRQFGLALVNDLATLANVLPGVLRRLRQLVSDARLGFDVPGDSDFETCYPIESRSDWNSAHAKSTTRARDLALVWSTCAPADIATRIARFEREAVVANINYPRYSPMVCEEIARQVVSPLAWARAMKEAGVIGDLILPFLKRAIANGESEWVGLAQECMGDSAIEYVTVYTVLEMEQPPDDLMDRVFHRLPDYSRLVETMCLRGQVPLKTMQRLLMHPDVEIASVAAQGEWYRDPKGQIRPELADDWRRVAVSTDLGDYWLQEVLKGDAQLAYDWLQRQVFVHSLDGVRDDKTMVAAASALDRESRELILKTMPEGWEFTKLVKELVGEDLGLYQVLLERTVLKQLHLAPLVGFPNESNWADRAALALDHGYSPEQIVLAVHGVRIVTMSWSGDESQFWKDWEDRFAALNGHQDERVRHIAQIGQKSMEANRVRASEEERMEAIYGMDDSRALGRWSRIRR